MTVNFNYPKLAKEKFEIALNGQMPMRERYEAIKFVKLYVDNLNLDFFNLFHQLRRDQKHAEQRWFYDGDKLTVKDHGGHRGADGVFKRHVFGPTPPSEDDEKAPTGATPDQEYVPDPDYDNRSD